MTPINHVRRNLLRASLAALPLASRKGQAADNAYPSRAIRILIGFPPGTGTDTWARLVALKLSPLLNQPVFVDNKPGAHGQLACNLVKSADKDGYTLLYAAGGTMAVNPSLYGKRLSYDPVKDFDPVIAMERSTIYLAVNKDLPVTNLKEMVAYVKSRPGQVNFGSAGAGTTSHLGMEMLKKATGMEMTHVPYKGGGAVLQDMMGGQIQFAFDAAAVMLPQRGNVRLIGVASAQRLPVTPDIPTIAEQGVPGFEAPVWSGLYAPAGTPKNIIAKLNSVLNTELKNGTFDSQIVPTGGERMGGTSEDHRAFLRSQIARWAPVVKESGAEPD